MEQGAVNGFNVLDKANSTLDVGKFAESFPCKIMMGHPYHQENPHRPLSAGDDDDPTSNHRKGANKMPCSNEQHIVYADAILHPPSATTGARTLQPFHISPGGMAAALEFPFTWAQWKELERQAMIYKYMVSAIPVPQDLLLQICTNSSGASQSASGSVQGRRHTNIRDLEPGRCKRTDGKKWRCSRDVAPHQKYCERHMHRGRPRSRKHVEVHANNNSNDSNNKKTRIRPESTPPMAAVPKPPPPAGQTAKSSTQHHRSTFQQMEGPLFFDDKMEQNISCNELHSSGWMMGSELVENADAGKRWQHLMDSNTDFSADVKFHPNLHHGSREEALNLMTCRDSEGCDDLSIRHNGEFYFMINPEVVEQSVKESPRNMFNAWSTDNVYNNNDNMEEASLWPSRGDISPSSLTLSMAMAAGDALDEDMGLESSVMSTAYQHKSWENNWFPFASGGPLAEVLHPNSSIQGENPASSYTSNGDSTSPAATTVSSPSGVLQKTMFSHSDGSVCSSPIPAPPTNTTSENVPFQWLR